MGQGATPQNPALNSEASSARHHAYRKEQRSRKTLYQRALRSPSGLLRMSSFFEGCMTDRAGGNTPKTFALNSEASSARHHAYRKEQRSRKTLYQRALRSPSGLLRMSSFFEGCMTDRAGGNTPKTFALNSEASSARHHAYRKEQRSRKTLYQRALRSPSGLLRMSSFFEGCMTDRAGGNTPKTFALNSEASSARHHAYRKEQRSRKTLYQRALRSPSGLLRMSSFFEGCMTDRAGGNTPKTFALNSEASSARHHAYRKEQRSRKTLFQGLISGSKTLALWTPSHVLFDGVELL